VHELVARTVITFCVACLAAACGGGGSDGTPTVIREPAYTYSMPDDIGDGWQVASLVDEGMSETLLTAMVQRILDGTYAGIDSVAIARNNRLVLYVQVRESVGEFDHWVSNTDPERHVLHSTSKSFTSALIGIAIDEGFIASVQVPFYDLFHYGAYDNWDPRKAEMTLEDALTMRLGLEWDEWTHPYTSMSNDLVFLENTNTDWAKALLDLPMTSDPGTVFAYNTAATIAIGQALENATGLPMEDFANQYLFFPMQIETAAWWKSPTGLPVGGSGLFLTTRDMLKFGQLFVDEGVWRGQQLISPEWVAASVTRHVDVTSWATYVAAYGYQWWLGDFEHEGATTPAYVTAGYGGQYIFAFPDIDIVVAFTGQNYENGERVANLYTIIDAYILRAID
jgi:CubicO group peptidase (beta-lactamase class C family)